MPINRFFSENPLMLDTEITIQGQELYHLVRVTRTRVGDHVELVNGKGRLARAVLKGIDKKGAVLCVASVSESPPPRLKTVLIQAIPRLNRLDFIVEKGTELGMDELRLFPAEKSEKKHLSGQQLQRLKTISISALKQCGRLFLPSITVHPPLAKWDLFPEIAYFGDIASNAKTLVDRWELDPPQQQCVFFIGPEGGFTGREVDRLRENNAKGVSLHPNILRTDTAALAALAIIHQLIMQKEGKGIKTPN